MDLDDFDDHDKVKPSQVPSRVSRFLPKSSKPVPKPEPQQLKKLKTEENNIKPQTETSVSNGDVKMEGEQVPEPEMEPRKEEPEDLKQLQDDEDTIVREIDVFFTPSIDDDSKLYQMQYLLGPHRRLYELYEKCEEVRVKLSTSEVEMDFSPNLDWNNWDSEKASRSNTTNMTTGRPLLATGYAVGVLVGNMLHLHPIHAVVQLRVSKRFLNSGGLKRKSNVAGEVSVKLEDYNQDKSVGSSKKQNKRMESSIEQKSSEEESWVPLKYHGSNSDLSARYLQRMLLEQNSPIHFAMSPHDHLSYLCSEAGNNNTTSQGRL